jgi:purine-binding chemotaxis protein CheW
MSILTFSVAGERYGVRAADVEEVLPAMSMARVPGVAPIIEGVVNLRGRAIPVLDMRARFGAERRPMEASDHLIVTRAGKRVVALRADHALELVPVREEDIVAASEVSLGALQVVGVAKLPDGVVIIHDPAAFLSQAEAARLDEALERAVEAAPTTPAPAPTTPAPEARRATPAPEGGS